MYFIKPVYATEKPANPIFPGQIIPNTKNAWHQEFFPKALQSTCPFHVRRKRRARNVYLFHNTLSRLSMFDANFTIAFFPYIIQRIPFTSS